MPFIARREPVMTEVLRNRSARERAAEKVTEQDRNPSACRRRQLCPGHGRCRAYSRHGASRPTSPRRVTRRDPTAAGRSPGIALQTSSGGQIENLIKLHKAQLASDRTSCREPLANQVRLILHTAAYWLLLCVRDAIPSPQPLATAEFNTLRLGLIKIGACIIETTRQVRIAFTSACPEADLFAAVVRGCLPAGP